MKNIHKIRYKEPYLIQAIITVIIIILWITFPIVGLIITGIFAALGIKYSTKVVARIYQIKKAINDINSNSNHNKTDI